MSAVSGRNSSIRSPTFSVHPESFQVTLNVDVAAACQWVVKWHIMMTPARTYDIVNSYGSNFEAMLG